MTTITAVELRKNLGDIMRRVERGERFAVTYRNRSRAILQGEQKPKRNATAGLEAFEKAPRKNFTFDPNKSYKELYDDLLREKYGRYMD
jgi:prevent-host-death family protein